MQMSFSTMDRYFNLSFWDPSTIWKTNYPDFTESFEKTTLLWPVCGFLWIFTIFDVYFLSDPKRGSSFLGHNPPSWQPGWTWLSVFKLLNITWLISVEIAALCINLYENEKHDWKSPTVLILIATHLLSAALIILHKNRCVHTSGIQLLHWSMLSVVHILMFRTEYNIYRNPIPSQPSITFMTLILLGVSISLMIVQSVTFCWSDIPSQSGQYSLIRCSDGIEREECPILRSSCLSYILFSWCTPLIRKGYKRPLTSDDLWEVIPSVSSNVVVKLFQKSYGKPLFAETRSIFRNIIRPLWSTCGGSFTLAIICRQISCFLSFLPPKLMGYLIDFVEDKETETWKGYVWAVLLLLNYIAITIFFEIFFLHMFKCYMDVFTGLNMCIYRKSMRVSTSSRRGITTGEVVNLMGIDVEAIRMVAFRSDEIWSAPLQIALGIYLIWKELGYAVFPGVGVLCAIIPFNWLISAKMSKYQRAQMKKKDERIKVISEVLSGIQVVKLYAWEPSFLKQIQEIRADEVGLLRKRAFCRCAMQFVLDSVPFMVSIAAFFTYVYMNGGILEPKKAFTALTLFTLLTDPIQDFPSAISMLVDARVSFQRVNKYLNAEENDPEATQFLPKSDDKPAVEIVDGTFAWEDIEEDHWRLENINLEVKTSSLTAIVGSVASGKSSLLSAMLGDMKHSSQVIIRGKVAYVPQVAWILNTTLRENICFGMPFDEDKYNKVIEGCCLGPDIEILPAGDMTEIGEKGINLSGGQKQRVSLARAAYSDADIFLLDDVLSAVDAHVGKQIFDKMLGPSGYLQEKTRILCTHAYQYLSQVDRIVVLDEGRIVESGSYDQLMLDSGNFATLVSRHVQSQNDASNNNLSSEITKKKEDDKKDVKNKEGQLTKAEHVETGDVKLSVFLKYAKTLGYPMALAFVLFFGCSEGLSLGRNLVLSKWTSHSSNMKNSTNYSTTSYAVEYASLGILQSVCYLFGYFFLAIATLRAAQLFHNKMLNRILHAPMSFFNVTPLGRVTNRFSSDIEGVDKKLPSQLGDWMCHIYKVFGIVAGIIYATNVYFVIYLIPLSVIYIFLQRHYTLCMQQLQRIYNVFKSPIYAQFQETLSGTSTLRAFNAEERFSRMLGDKIDNFNRALLPHIMIRRWLGIRLGILGSTVVFVPALIAVLWRQTMDPSLVGLAISYAIQITAIINWLIRVTSYLQYTFVSVERIVEYSAVEQEAEFEYGRKECSPNWPEKGNISFEGYETRYRTGLDLVLKNFTCQIASGEKIGIVGRTGAGKSSLTLAIFRIIEASSGEIQIDGVNIADLGLHEVRKRLTVIPQDPVLFSRSLRLNLDPFEEYEDEKIWRALEMAHLKSYVDGLDEGLNFPVAEGGENLSLGQRQLVCLARAILKKSSILILDEATASVDSVTDELIQKTIRAHFGDCTILNVAHRLNTVLDSTRILVLDRGEMVEFDTPQQLLSNPESHFYAMAKDAGVL